MVNMIKWFFSTLFGSASVQMAAKVGIKIGLASNPELIPPVKLASQAVIDKIDGKEVVSVSMIEGLLDGELAKVSLSKDKYGLAQAAIAEYKPILLGFLGKITPSVSDKIDLSDAQKKEVRALAVFVNQAAGGTAK